MLSVPEGYLTKASGTLRKQLSFHMRFPSILASVLVSLTMAHPVGAAPPASVSMAVQPQALTVPSGRTGLAEITIETGGDSGAKVIALWANEGSFGKVEPAGPGRFRAQWSATGLGFPTVVLMRADMQVAGKLVRRWIVLPISIAMNLPVEAGRGERVEVFIGGSGFGPVVAKARGTVAVPIVVPPAAGSYTVNRTDDYNVTKSETLHFGLPAFKRMAIAGPASGAAGDIVELDVFHVDARGQPYTSEVSVEVNCPDGSLLEIIGREAEQRMRVRLGGRLGSLECRVFLKSEPKISVSHSLEVTAARRLALGIEVSPRRLAIDSAGSARVLVRARDLFGNTAEAPALRVTANGRSLEVTRLASGLYQCWIYAPSSRQPGDRIVVEAVATGARPEKALVRLRGGISKLVSATARPQEIQADGKRWVLVEVTATDRHGMPANDGSVRVESAHGKLLFLHRVSPGLFRGHFVPHRSPGGGKAVISVQTERAREVQVFLDLKPIPQRLLLSPVMGVFGDVLRTVGVGTALRVEYGIYRGMPNVFVGGTALFLPGFSIQDGHGSLVSHWGLIAGAAALLRLRLVSTLRFGLDASLDAGVLGLYSSYTQRYLGTVQRNEGSRPLFTAAAALEIGVVTVGRQEIFFLLQVRYLTGRFEDAGGESRLLLLGGLGYRFPL